MTLNDQKTAAIAHRDADMANYDQQMAFKVDCYNAILTAIHSNHDTEMKYIAEQNKLSFEAHQKAIAVIDAQIEAHIAFIGEAA